MIRYISETAVWYFTRKFFDRFLEKSIPQKKLIFIQLGLCRFKPLNEESFGSTFPSSDEGSPMLMSILESLSRNPPMNVDASDKLLNVIGSIPSELTFG